MPLLRDSHQQRALFQQGMAEASATSMARKIHYKLAAMHSAAADARDMILTPVPDRSRS
jgi:hypothetical protein